jgi:general secretion pathway protein M
MNTARKYAGRFCAVALLVGLIAGLHTGLIRPLVEAHHRLDMAQAEASEQLAHYRGIAGKRSAVEALLTELESQQAATGIYLRGGTDSLAAVELQDRINAQIKKTGGKLRSVRVLKSETDEDFKRVAISVESLTTISAFQKLLYEIEASRPLLLVQDLEIKNTRRRANNNKLTEEPLLLIRLEVCGFVKPVTE